jgi:ATP-dependent RNA/DNA helicase IGHMBP2
VALVHGPPGTGKTTTIVEYILQAVKLQKAKVLSCAPSNLAVDNVIERLHQSNPDLKIVRFGHPSRMIPSVQKFALETLIKMEKDRAQEMKE